MRNLLKIVIDWMYNMKMIPYQGLNHSNNANSFKIAVKKVKEDDRLWNFGHNVRLLQWIKNWYSWLGIFSDWLLCIAYVDFFHVSSVACNAEYMDVYGEG